jgi:hypothetical protein
MTSATTLPRIISTVLHHIDVESKTHLKIQMPKTNAELESYLDDLLDEIKDKPQKREYGFISDSTQFYKALSAFNNNKDFSASEDANEFAKRLLEKEIVADKRHGHLGQSKSGKNTHIKKGSFLQFIYRNDNKIAYLGVKIDHQSYLDEKDFTKRIGLAIAKKLYKACLVNLQDTGVPESIHVYDTNATPAHYWWYDFLELKETRDDSVNTKKAIESIVKTLGIIKKEHPIDYAVLRNASIAAFKQSGEMKFDVFVENTFAQYVPENTELVKKLPALITKLKELPTKSGFDSLFNLSPKDVPYNFQKVKLSNDITLTINEGVKDIEKKIWAEKTKSGKKLIVIEVSENFSEFPLRERIL